MRASVLYQMALGAYASAPSALPAAADVVVYGANFAGVMAAISAKRTGASVIVVNDLTPLAVGGMVTGGVQFTDSQTGRLGLNISTIRGLTKEFYRRCATYYGKSVNRYFSIDNWSCESHVAMQVLVGMINEAGVQIYNGELLSVVIVEENQKKRITSMTFHTGTVACKQVVDATYPGDLVPLAGISAIIGREAASQYGEGAFGAGTSLSAAQPINPVDPYVIEGDPNSGKIKFVSDYVQKPLGSAEPTVMAMGLRPAICGNAANRGAWPMPANYNPDDFLLARRAAIANPTQWNDITKVFNIQKALPTNSVFGNKRDMNQAGFFSLNYVHPETTEYVTATPARRREIDRNILDYTQGFIYCVATHSDFPQALRTQMASYGPSLDEYTDGNPPYWQPVPYCREGHRIVGDAVYTAVMMASTTYNTSEPIARCFYPFDSHGCNYFINSSGKVNREGSGLDGDARVMNKMPLSLIKPKASECTNLTFACAVSASHVAYSSLRMEPVFGATGEACGALAGYAAMHNLTVPEVTYDQLNTVYDYYGFNNNGGCTITADGTTRTDGTIEVTGSYAFLATSASTSDTAGVLSCNATDGDHRVKVTPALPANGTYGVYVKWNAGWTTGTLRGTVTLRCVAAGVEVFNQAAMRQDYQSEFDPEWLHLGNFACTSGIPADNFVEQLHGNGNPTNLFGVKFKRLT